MFNRIAILLLICITAIYAIDRPTNYFAGSSSARGDQQQIQDFAAYNLTAKTWVNVLPPGVPAGTLNGIVAVGNGFLAFGSFSTLSGGSAAGLAYYDGTVWSAPEGVGLYTYTPSNTLQRYDQATTGVGSAYAAVVVNNVVYLVGDFNQVGLVRGGVSGFVALTWSAGGIFSIGYVGNGYFETVGGVCSTLCPSGTYTKGTKNKLLTYTLNGVQTFVIQDSAPGNLFMFQPNSASWTRISSSNGARGLLGNIQDFDINGGNIYVVGKFDNTNDGNIAKQYLHLAVSPDGGNTWNAISNTQPFPTANFATLPPLINQTNNQVIYQGLDAQGLTAIYVENANSIYVAGGFRVAERNTSSDNLAGQMQHRVFQITNNGATLTPLSERFGAITAAAMGTAPEYKNIAINRITKAQGILFVWGNFNAYRQIVPSLNTKYGQRFTNIFKGAACYVNNQWAQAWGGWITTGFASDASPSQFSLAWSSNQDTAYFMTIGAERLLSTYNLVSGGLFAWGGDKTLNQNNRWNAVLGNQRFVSGLNGWNAGFGSEGQINTMHLTKRGDALIIGGKFDWIGSQSIGGVAWYNSQSDTVSAVGGGLFTYNNVAEYGQDLIYNNRNGGTVWDFEERGDLLFAGGQFNRNNSGSAIDNIACVKFRQSGAGWQQVDGGCDNVVRDLLIVGSKLYITGDFLFCGLRGTSYTGNLAGARGRTPTNRIAVIDLDDSKGTWRNLGVGLSSGSGQALAWRNGDLFVGGTFGSAGGKQYTSGIARWRNDHWEDVVAKCRGNCDRPQPVFTYINNNPVPQPTERLPLSACNNLREFDGLIYCADGTRFAYFDSNTWYQGGLTSLGTYSGLSNTLFARNATRSRYILASGSTDLDSNGANILTFNQKYNELYVTYGGFSTPARSLSDASSIIYSSLLLISIVLAYIF